MTYTATRIRSGVHAVRNARGRDVALSTSWARAQARAARLRALHAAREARLARAIGGA